MRPQACMIIICVVFCVWHCGMVDESLLNVSHWLEQRFVKKCAIFSYFDESVTDGPTDRRTDGRTDPLIEMRGRIQKDRDQLDHMQSKGEEKKAPAHIYSI